VVEQEQALGGRERLIRAALRLGARKRSLNALGLRELGREAGLNPNTFYRHFKSLEDLSLAIIEQFGSELRPALSSIRRGAASPQQAALRSTEHVFDFAARNPEVFIVGVRELHGASPAVRQALREALEAFAGDMADDVRLRGLAPGLGPQRVSEISMAVVRQTFYLCLDYLEQPSRRDELVRQTVDFIEMLIAGALALQALQGRAPSL
jgi:AcrR family transcriptional regulator